MATSTRVAQTGEHQLLVRDGRLVHRPPRGEATSWLVDDIDVLIPVDTLWSGLVVAGDGVAEVFAAPPDDLPALRARVEELVGRAG
jgi:hypothetical protein